MSVEHELRDAVVIENKQIARGSFWIKLKSIDDEPIVYQPGNVLSMFINDSYGVQHRKPYTVSLANIEEKTFEHLYRVIPNGNFTNKLIRLQPGDKVYFRGVFHKPIHEEILPDAKAIVGISTGTGIGPLYGFAKKVLSENIFSVPLTLYVGFRYNEDLCLKEELDALAEQYPNFKWYPTFTRPTNEGYGLKGRVTEVVPQLIDDLQDTHFHLVGNGRMISEFIPALKNAGVLQARISRETYFNHGAKVEDNIIEEISKRFKVVVN